MKKVLFSTLLAFSLISCAQTASHDVSNDHEPMADMTMDKDLSELSTAYFASGCFWCVEAVFESVNGVQEAVSGYSGGTIKNPTYQQVSSGRTRHAEAVKVYYDPDVVDYQTLVNVFYNSHDPTTLNRQGPDAGPQYRSVAFYENDEEKEIIESTIQRLLDNKTFDKITTEVTALDVFYDAEDYHQDYEKNHPNQGYVKAVSIPRLNAFKRKMPEVLKESAKLHE